MKKREAAIITAYTGVFCGAFKEFHKYIEELMNRPIYTHELASLEVTEIIKKKSEKDFLSLCEHLED